MEFNNTSWNLYKSFVVVYEVRNLHRAAEKLGISRSAIRQNIRELGNQLGVTLFIPHQKGVMPTGDATTIYPNVKKAVDLIIAAENSVDTFTADSTGTIKIAMSNTLIIMFMAEYMAQFGAKFPKVVFEFFSLESLPRLEKGEIDLILDDDIFFQGSDLCTIHLFSAASLMVASKSFLQRHNLGATLTADDFARLPVIVLGPSSYDVGHTNPYIKTVSVDMTYYMVKAGLGIGHFAKEMLDSIADPNIVAVNIIGVSTPEHFNVVCGYNKTLSKPARAFVEGLQEFCKKRYGA